MHHCCKFGENESNTLQDIVLMTFWDAHTDARMDKQDRTIMLPATLRWAEAQKYKGTQLEDSNLQTFTY